MTRTANISVCKPACPRCGCYLTSHFECGCGACKDDYCVNCGRFRSLGPDEHVELSPFDAICPFGAVPHEHSRDEKHSRMAEYMLSARMKSRRPEGK